MRLRRLIKISWFDASKERAFGQELADLYLSKLVRNDSRKSSKSVEQKHRQLVDEVTRRATLFVQENRSNVYKRAAFANAFKWRLRDEGLDEQQADEIISWITAAGIGRVT